MNRQMTCRAATMCVMLPVAMAGGGLWAAQGAKEADKPPEAFPAGNLQSVKQELSDVLVLKLATDRLTIDREHWAEAAKAVKDKGTDPMAVVIQNLVPGNVKIGVMNRIVIQGNVVIGGNGGATDDLSRLFWRLHRVAGGGSTWMNSSTGSRSMGFTGGKLSVRLTDRADAFKASVQDEGSPGLTLNLAAHKDGRLSIVLVAPEQGAVLLMRQGKDGAFSVKEVVGDAAHTRRAESFVRFCIKHKDYANGRLLPLLERVGIAMPVGGRGDPTTIAAVVAVLRHRRDKDAPDKARKLIRQLDDDAYATREQATRALSEGFVVYYPYLQPARKQADLSVEVAQRLAHIFKDNAAKMKTVTAVYPPKLYEDPRYLASILDRVGADDRKTIIDALKCLTKKDFGTDAAAWRKHVGAAEAEPKKQKQ